MAAAYKAAGPDDQKKICADLKKNITETFDLREKARQLMTQVTTRNSPPPRRPDRRPTGGR